MAGYPVAWALGLSLVFPIVAAIPMLLWLVANRPLRLPAGAGLFGLFLVIVMISGIGLSSAGALALFGLRAGWYTAAFITFLYLARYRGPAGGPVMAMVWLWIGVVAGGWLSVLAPELTWSTPISALTPGALADNELISRLITPRVSETQIFRFEDVVLHRPAAPFAYTNGWGSAMALLTPFAIAALHDRRVGIPRSVVTALLVAGLVPLSVALNRGSWLTLGLGLAWGAVRWSRIRRDPRPVLVLVALLVAGLALASVTGLLQQSVDQLATRSADSNDTRAGLYQETLAEAARSPLIGYGSTRPSVDNPDGPPLGTHGQAWAVLFAHGYLGVGLYVGFFVLAFFRARAEEPIQHWAKVSLLIGLAQLPIYGHLPAQLLIMVGAAVIAAWPRDEVAR